jgi:hypothetical protein
VDRPVSVSADAKSYNIGIGSEVQKAGSGHPYSLMPDPAFLAASEAFTKSGIGTTLGITTI